MISCTNIRVKYKHSGSDIVVLDNITWATDAPVTAVMGPSGSGKSTFLRILSGAQRPLTGTVTIDEMKIVCTEPGLTNVRVSTIYQDFRLIDFLTVEENLHLAAEIRRVATDSKDILRVTESVGVEHLLSRYPAQISGGEQQRVSIARSLMTEARVILADEPTGSLDRVNSDNVSRLLVNIARTKNLQIIVATHDERVAAAADAVYEVSDGQLAKI